VNRDGLWVAPGIEDHFDSYIFEFRRILSRLFDTPADAKTLLTDAGFDICKIDLSGSANQFWSRILDEACKHGVAGLRCLLDHALVAYPQNPYLLILGENLDRHKSTLTLPASLNVDQPVSNRELAEFVGLLAFRAAEVRREMSESGQWQDFLSRFEQLHAEHVKALAASQIILAHEIYRRINALLYDYQHARNPSHRPPAYCIARISRCR
jgi:hypothetical protein